MGTKAAGGSLDAGYQLKDVKGIAGLSSASRKAALQLTDAPANLKVALMDVHAPHADLDTGTLQSLTDRAARSGITFHLRFSDGQDLTVPSGARVYPGK